MRQIKFRGQNNFSFNWVVGSLLIKDETQDQIMTYAGFKHDVLPETIGQYTGLKDENSVEIYEGDILKHKDPNGYYSKKWEVIFYSGSFFIAGLPNKIRIYNVGERQNTSEIIGNIHENPELLK